MNVLDNFMSMATPICVAVPFLIIALVLIFLALRNRGHVNRALRHWEGVQGRILSSQAERRVSSTSDGTSISFYPVVVYEYQVGGRIYQGRRLSFGTEVGWGGFTKMAQKKVEQYPPGSIVPVYYNPENPTEAVLEVRASVARVYWLIAIFIIVVVGVTLFFSLGMNGMLSNVMQSASSVSK